MRLLEQYWNGESRLRLKYGEPKTRLQLFRLVLSERVLSLVPVNLLYVVFWIPAIVWTVANILTIRAAITSGNPGTDTIRTMNLYVLGLWPCIAITGPADAGISLLMRNWARDQECPAFRTIWKGFRENFGQAIVVSAITGLIPVSIWYCYLAASQAGTMQLMSVLLIVTCVVFALWMLSRQVVFVLLVTYRLSLAGHLRNAFLLTLMKLPMFLLIRIAASAVLLLYLALCLCQPEARYALLALPLLYYFFIGGALTHLIYCSYANKLCDDYLGK